MFVASRMGTCALHLISKGGQIDSSRKELVYNYYIPQAAVGCLASILPGSALPNFGGEGGSPRAMR